MNTKSEKLSKSEKTRSAILKAAQKIFYELGYDRATVRLIAREVPIDPAMIIRYFGSKEGLFSAATVVDLRLPDGKQIPNEKAGTMLVGHFLSLWEGGEKALGLQILLRSAVSSQDAADKIHSVFQHQVVPAIARITPQDDSAKRAGLVVSQLFGLALCRYILKLPPVVDLSREEIITTIGPVIQSHLGE